MNTKTYKEWWNSIDDYLAHMLMKEGYDHNKVYNVGITELRAAGEEDKQMTMDEFVEFVCRKTGVPYSDRTKIKRNLMKVNSSRQIKSSWYEDYYIFKDNMYEALEKGEFNKYKGCSKNDIWDAISNHPGRRYLDINDNDIDEMTDIIFRNINSSLIRSARYIVKRNDTNEYLGWIGENTYWVKNVKNASVFDSKEYIEKYKGELMGIIGLNDRFTIIENSRQIKSGLDPYLCCPSCGEPELFENIKEHNIKCYNCGNTISYDELKNLKKYVSPHSKITSARYIATDPESGEVLGSADTYEEVVNEWGEDVTITDSEAAEGEENVGLFQSRKITSAVDGGWEVRSSDVPEALDLFVEYFGEEDALEEIAKAMGDNVLEENIDWIAQQWGFAEELEDKEVWDKYETAKELMGESELFNNLTQAAGYDELAEDLAFIFRMNDFREWDKYDNEDEDEYDDDDISEDGKGQAIFGLLYNIVKTENNLDAWSTGHYSKETSDKISNLAFELEHKLEDYYDYGMPSLLEEYESKGGTYSINNGDPDNGDFDNEEIAKEIFNRAIKRINEFEEWENAQEYPDLDFAEWLEQNYPDEAITSSYSNSKKNNIVLNNSFPIRTVQNIMSGKWSEDYAVECIAQKQNINVGYARQILSSWIDQYKPKLIKSGILDIAEDINTAFDIDGDLESWAEQYTNNSGKSNTVGGEMVRAAMQIIYRYNNDGDMIGRGYGNETVNAAARYITEKAEMGVNEQIQKWLDHEERADADDYDSFIKTFTTEVEQVLRENPELFQKPNKDDYWDWREDDDMNYGLDEVYLDDGNGNQYWFKLSNDRWTCTGIELDPYSVTYQEGDTINEGDEYSDEILSPSEEFGSFEADGFIYEYAGDDWDDDREQYTSWQITSVKPQDPYCDDGETFDFYDLEPDELYGYTLYDHNGNEVDERTFLASSLKVK